MMRKACVVVAVSAALIAGVYAADNAKPKTAKVGEFAMEVSRALGHQPADEKAAAGVLRSAGVDLGVDLSADLTEGKAATILRDLGVAVTTANPGQAMSADKAHQLVLSAGLTETAAATLAAVDLPGQCLQERNRGQCNTCCQVYLGCNLKGSCEYASTCSRYCKQVLPPGQASPREPTP